MSKRMNYISSVFISSCLLLSACGDAPLSQDSNSGFKKVSYQQTSPKNNTAINKMKLPDAPVSVQWRGTGKRIPDAVNLVDPSSMKSYSKGKTIGYEHMPIEQFLTEFGTITFTKGDDFFKDWKLEVNVRGLKPNATIRLENASTMMSEREQGERVPDTHFMKDAQGFVKTGKLTELGMPIQVSLSTQEKIFMKKPVRPGNYYVAGKAFATIGDIRINNGKLDTQYDSLRTIYLVARDYINSTMGNKLVNEKLTAQATTYSSDKNEKGVREGVEGLVVFKKSSNNQLIRLHLVKQADGWQGKEVLKPWQLLYTREKKGKHYSDVMEANVYKKVESFLKRKKLTNHINSNISCNYGETMGLCTAIITVLENNKKTCAKKAYLFKKKKKGKKFNYIKEVGLDLKMDYVNKKHILVKDKRKAKLLKESVMNKALGLMLGQCSMF